MIIVHYALFTQTLFALKYKLLESYFSRANVVRITRIHNLKSMLINPIALTQYDLMLFEFKLYVLYACTYAFCVILTHILVIR